MIENKLLDLSAFKTLDEVARELDNLANYEGWLVVCAAGKKGNILVLRRNVEYPEPTPPKKGKGAVSKQRFPNAVYQ